MHTRLLRMICAMILLPCIAGVSATRAQDEIALESVAVLSGYGDASLSPDGRYLALVVPRDDGDQVAVVDLANPDSQPRGYVFDRAIVTDLYWHANDAVVARMYGRFTTFNVVLGRAYIVYTATDKKPEFIEYQPPTARRQSIDSSYVASLDEVIDVAPEIGTHFFMTGLVRRPANGMQTWRSDRPDIWAMDLLRVNLSNGTAVSNQLAVEETAQWVMDGRGNVVARIDVPPSRQQVIFVPDGDGFRQLTAIENQAGNEGDIIGLSHDGRSLVVRSRRGARLGLHPIDLETGDWGEPIYENPEFDVGGIILDERTFRVIGIDYFEGSLAQYHYFVPELQLLQSELEGVFPEHSVRILSMTNDENKVLFEILAPGRAPTLGLFDLQENNITTIVDSYPGLLAGPKGTVSAHPYTALDGTTIVGALTLPPGEQREALPTVVLEQAPLAETFDKLAHFLATRGYAVFRPGVRQIRRFRDVSGMRELEDWTSMMQEDISSGINDLVAKGITDPDRVCMIGRGEEGYMALMTAVLSPDLFACVVSVGGPADLRRLVNAARFASHLPIEGYNSALVRNHEEYADEDLERFSPMLHADEIHAPILLVSFDRDTHTASMNAALRRADKTVEYVELVNNIDDPAEDRSENLVIEYEAIEQFLSAQIGP